jgi:AcrR family transcriptional regulator
MAAPIASHPNTSETHRRIITAAAMAFARSGLQGATTRQIARDAHVNEVTLFRHFQTKEKLIAAVLQHTFEGQDEANALPPGDAPADLRTGLARYARRYDELLQGNILLVRTLLGEIHRHREHESRVLKGILAPLKAALVLTIEAARARGEIRPEIDPVIAADLFGSMIFLDVLKRSSPWSMPEYPKRDYLETAVDVLVRGIEVTPRQPLPATAAPAPAP